MIDYRRMYEGLEQALAGIEKSAEDAATLSGILAALIEAPEDRPVPLGLTAARLYRHDADARTLTLIASVGEPTAAQPGFTVPTSYPPVQTLFRDGFVLLDDDDPEFDADIEGSVATQRFAAISVGRPPRHVIAFTMRPDIAPDLAIYVLGTIRHVINLKLAQGAMVSDLHEARRIQKSLLPIRAPEFHGFDLAARSVAAESVGGDLYDYIPLSSKNLGVAIADACGHGLPAALMARDVITALRVVLDIHYRLTYAIERVNKVVAKASLASRFISLFYAEFEPSGNLVYCNAGHPPPILLRRGGVDLLDRGGIVLGPDQDADYERGFKVFPPGSTLVAYTDGIIEAASPEREEFGLDRLARCVDDCRGLEAEQVVERVFEAVAEHAPGAPDDDRTVVVVRRPRERR